MAIIHFLNVKEGDCTWIEHLSGHNTVIDISNGTTIKNEQLEESYFYSKRSSGNHNRKEYPTNPIEYFKHKGVSSIFRFILTHPDMDHMDGIKDLFDEFRVVNFWDTDNNKTMGEEGWGRYSKDDWEFYQRIRKSETYPTVLNLYAGARGPFYNQSESGKVGQDGLYILAPTRGLVDQANETEDYNDCSYVILYKTGNKKIVFAGDSSENTWNYILDNYEDDVTDIDILLAPHHGRKSGGNDKYLDILKPKLTLFGNAKSQYLDYGSWNRRSLDHITNNQADNIIIDVNNGRVDVYVSYEIFAKKRNPKSTYNKVYDAWYIMSL